LLLRGELREKASELEEKVKGFAYNLCLILLNQRD